MADPATFGGQCGTWGTVCNLWSECISDVVEIIEGGGARDPQYWAEVLPGPIAPPMVGLNGDISWMELNRVLRIMRSGSAPGCDGIPPEFPLP